jgi:hypothetical protein
MGDTGAVATRNDVLYSTENRRDERHTSDGLSRQPWRWQSRLARRFSLAEPIRPLSGAACPIGTTGTTGTHGISYPGGAPQPDPIRRFILTVADVARRVATGFGYPGQVTASRGDATDDLASLTIVSFFIPAFPNSFACGPGPLAGRRRSNVRATLCTPPLIRYRLWVKKRPIRNGRLARGVIHAWH